MTGYPSDRQRTESRIAGLRLAGENDEANELEATLSPAPKLTLIDGNGLGDDGSRHAGSDADAFLAADPQLFDMRPARTCERCGKSLDGRRIDAETCSSSCRGRRWRSDGQDLDAERNR